MTYYNTIFYTAFRSRKHTLLSTGARYTFGQEQRQHEARVTLINISEDEQF